jgi:hypothetical protein
MGQKDIYKKRTPDSQLETSYLHMGSKLLPAQFTMVKISVIHWWKTTNIKVENFSVESWVFLAILTQKLTAKIKGFIYLVTITRGRLLLA